eukprot:Nk52_evm23s2011 gene=Nk52_evmTU23s2011
MTARGPVMLVSAMRRALQRRKDTECFRTCAVCKEGAYDFASNDYLGLARSRGDSALPEGSQKVDSGDNDKLVHGSTGSRLLTGYSSLFDIVERQIAHTHSSETALLFNSGYDANLGFFGCVPQKNDIVLFDELIHASVHDGLKLSRGTGVPFKHNCLSNLQAQLEAHYSPGRSVVVAVESVYSMDGDVAPLEHIGRLCRAYGAALVVDEAHSTGVYGKRGEGLVQALGLQDEVFARLHTFGKGMGCHGAAIVGPEILKEYLINYSRPLIYSTSLPPHSLHSIRAAYGVLGTEGLQRRRAHLFKMIELFRLLADQSVMLRGKLLPSQSAIQGVLVRGNAKCVRACNLMTERGFDVRPIRSPTVAKGTERIRIVLHSHNTKEEVEQLVYSLEEVLFSMPEECLLRESVE